MADRVIVFSARPASVQKIIPIRLDTRDKSPLAARNAPNFKSYFNLIWKELNPNA
jgi:NitT/TauT family transport system ATP-binding protein